MAMGKTRFKDVCPIKNCDFPVSHLSFQGLIIEVCLQTKMADSPFFSPGPAPWCVLDQAIYDSSHPGPGGFDELAG